MIVQMMAVLAAAVVVRWLLEVRCRRGKELIFVQAVGVLNV